MINILQWNINGAYRKKASLLYALHTADIDIAVLQETLVTNTENFRISGYNTFALQQDQENRGLIILIKNTIPAKTINPIYCGDRVEVMGIEINLAETTLTLYNIYRNWANNNLNMNQLFDSAIQQPTLILGDFNAHHTILNSIRDSNEGGEHISHLLDTYPDITLLNNGHPTHIRGGRLDLAFLNTHLRNYTTWKIDDNICQSDHFAINIQLDLPQLPPIPPPPPRWNQDLANWQAFQNSIQNWVETYTPADDINTFESDLIKALHTAADVSMPNKQHKNFTFTDSWYYNQEVRHLKSRLNRVRKVFRKRRTEDNRLTLQEVSRDVNTRLAQIRQDTWYDWCTKLSRLTKLKDIWDWLKRATGKHKQNKSATHPNPIQEANRLAETFSNRSKSEIIPLPIRLVQQRLQQHRWDTINTALNTPDDTDTPYTLQELRATYKTSKDTAPGADKITYTMIRQMGTRGEEITLRLINKTHIERVRPESWNKQDTQPIPKINDPGNYRPIALLSCLEKTAEKMALKRLTYKVGPLHNQLYAYREGIGTTECITDVMNCINNNKAIVCFIDFEKAFELASATVILHSLARKGVKGHLLAWTKNYSTNREARVKFQGHLSDYKHLENGTPQGGILSPFLFNILMENIANLHYPQLTDIFIFADDLAIVSRGSRRFSNMQNALNSITNKATELGLKINTNKTKALAIKCQDPQQQLVIGNQHIQWVEHYKYLGVYLDKQLNSEKQVTYLRERAKARLAPMRNMTTTKEGATYHIQRLYYTATIRSLIDYSAPTLINLKETQYTKLEVIQNNALRLMLGAPMWTRLCNLQHEGNLCTLKTRIEIRNLHNTAKCLISDRPSTSKTKTLDDINKHPDVRNTKAYSYTIGNIIRKHNLLDTYKNIREDKTDPLFRQIPWGNTGATFNYTTLPVSKHLCNTQTLKTAALNSIRKVETSNTYSLYTDGSVDPTTETAGAAVHSNRFTGSWRVSNTASTMQTELLAILQALKYTVTNETGPVVIHCDSQAALKALQSLKLKENRNLLSQIHVQLGKHANQNRDVTFNWIPSHIGIIGNDEADRLAKHTNQIDRIQIHIQQSLQQIKNKTHHISKTSLINNVKLWVEHNSRSAKWYFQTTDLIPPPVDRHTDRELAVVIHRLRLGYRANWEIVTNTIRPCNHCNTDTESPLLHYLLQCPHTNNFRTSLHISNDINSNEALDTAYKIAKTITQNYETYANTLTLFPPPR